MIFVKIYRDWFFFPLIFQIWDLADTDGKGVLSKQVRLRDSSKFFVGLVQFEVKSSRFFLCLSLKLVFQDHVY